VRKRATGILVTLLAAGHATATPALTHDDVIWLNRIGMGVDSAMIARYQALGRDGFLDEQLAGPPENLPAPVAAMIAGYDAERIPVATLAANFRDEQQRIKALGDGPAQVDARKAERQHEAQLEEQAQSALLLREVYGQDALREQMTWFWLNHFSIFGGKARVRLFVGDYVQHAIRPHALGKFSDLLMASLTSPAMLDFLDNSKNAKGKLNENYARELMELHTLGVNGGYTQDDVQQMALILTGVGIRLDDTPRRIPPKLLPYYRYENLFEFNPARHDFADKQLLGRTIKGTGFDEVQRAVLQLTRQPACARFISQKLADYFVDDNPPPALVTRMTTTFLKTDGDIAQVLRTLFTAPELAAAPPAKFKDPNRFVVSAVRLTYDGAPIINVKPLVNWTRQMAQPAFGRLTPDGWSLNGSAWSSSGQLARRFEIARAIGGGNRLFAADDNAPPPKLPPPVLHDSELVATTVAPWLSAPTRAALDASVAAPRDWNTYLLSSPEFNQR
jgi:uncharacterized protein (DUF1800 family)